MVPRKKQINNSKFLLQIFGFGANAENQFCIFATFVYATNIFHHFFSAGLMGRGLGGMTERAQNENLMEQKFAEQMDDEQDVQHENEARSRS